ncbi:unnamed protein product [Diamesa tonsa]
MKIDKLLMLFSFIIGINASIFMKKAYAEHGSDLLDVNVVIPLNPVVLLNEVPNTVQAISDIPGKLIPNPLQPIIDLPEKVITMPIKIISAVVARKNYHHTTKQRLPSDSGNVYNSVASDISSSVMMIPSIVPSVVYFSTASIYATQ